MNRSIYRIYPLICMALYLLPAFTFNSMASPQKSETIKEIEKQKSSTDKEIAGLKAEIGTNQKAVASTLSDLRKIEGEIATSQNEINTAQKQLQTINTKITALEKDIDATDKELNALREDYLKAIKKMRVARKKNSPLAFIFASESFSEAGRRLRYLREFAAWKERQSANIIEKNSKLKEEKALLVEAKKDADLALRHQIAAQNQLKSRQEEQKEVVGKLRADGDALKAHLAKKQAEARNLGNKISALIAEQQAKEAEERRIEQQRKEAEEKRLAEQRKKEKEAEERRVAEQKKAEEEKLLAEQKKQAEQQAKKEQAHQAKQEDTKKQESKQQGSKTQDNKQPTTKQKEQVNEESILSYADARKKSPRSSSSSKSGTSTKTPAETKSAATFDQMKGSLPRPVAGNFRIISAFGVHPVSPEMPDIMDENTGIDVHVANGASASAVFDGEVIKIYDRTTAPGFRNIVVVKHGDYLTVYANLETLSVKSGQKVKQGQTLGNVGADFDDPAYGLIHFELWKGQTRQDPAAWLKK